MSFTEDLMGVVWIATVHDVACKRSAVVVHGLSCMNGAWCMRQVAQAWAVIVGRTRTGRRWSTACCILVIEIS